MKLAHREIVIALRDLDLDGSVGLRDDPFTGVRIDDGALALPTGPGIGATNLQETPITWDKD
ncbi:hypothetical protein [Streptomyces sp. MUM 178J]|uniref:hypothetical protein n=1 Tax=Streptomyces sp. MUM 178J TaxID=2791991 RepID=UPI001F033D4B|nr:hypothetical protein [Streptomyces sp. MUM 178J]WRQ80763.1 hypothetical protein I3F59_016130 [Streptomyces sp. MUM 178J]